MDTGVGDLEHGDILIDGSRIAAVGSRLEAGGAEEIDATGCLVIPGFVDTHRHMWQAVLRGCAPHHTLADYFDHILGEIGPALTSDDLYLGNLLSAPASCPRRWRSAPASPGEIHDILAHSLSASRSTSAPPRGSWPPTGSPQAGTSWSRPRSACADAVEPTVRNAVPSPVRPGRSPIPVPATAWRAWPNAPPSSAAPRRPGRTTTAGGTSA